MRTNWSEVIITEDNADELIPLALYPNEARLRSLVQRFGAVGITVWDPDEKYQIHPNFRGVRRGL